MSVSRAQRDRIGQYMRGRLHLRVVADTTQEAYNAYDRALKEELAGHGIHALCEPGCSACCDQLVLITSVEAATILARFPEVVVDAGARMAHNADRFERLCVEGGHDPNCLNFVAYPERAEERSRLLLAWFQLREPCVFLDRARGRCRVYSARPGACRNHILWNHPENHPEQCDDRTSSAYVHLYNADAYGPLLQRFDELMAEHYGRAEMGPVEAAVQNAVLRELPVPG